MTMQTFTPAQRVAVLLIGVIGVLVPGLQPQLLGALAADGRISEAMLGHVATIELLAMGISAGGAGIVLARAPLRMVGIAGIALCVMFDLLTTIPGVPLLVVRAGAGLAEGTLVWIAIGLITRSDAPARWSALYLVAQTAGQFAVATVLAFAMVPASASTGGFIVLGIATGAGLLALPWLPRTYAPLPRGDGASSSRIPTRGLVALGGVVLYLAFSVVVWVYVEPIAHARGVGAETIKSIAPISLAMQIAGALLALRLAGRVPVMPVLLAIGTINVLLLGIMATSGGDAIFLVAASAFGFLWLLALPFHVLVAIHADPTRRAAELIGGAQLIGAAFGPFAGGLVLHAGNLDTVLVLAGAFLIGALLLFILSGSGRKITPPADIIGGTAMPQGAAPTA